MSNPVLPLGLRSDPRLASDVEAEIRTALRAAGVAQNRENAQAAKGILAFFRNLFRRNRQRIDFKNEGVRNNIARNLAETFRSLEKKYPKLTIDAYCSVAKACIRGLDYCVFPKNKEDVLQSFTNKLMAEIGSPSTTERKRIVRGQDEPQERMEQRPPEKNHSYQIEELNVISQLNLNVGQENVSSPQERKIGGDSGLVNRQDELETTDLVGESNLENELEQVVSEIEEQNVVAISNFDKEFGNIVRPGKGQNPTEPHIGENDTDDLLSHEEDEGSFTIGSDPREVEDDEVESRRGSMEGSLTVEPDEDEGDEETIIHPEN